MSYSRWGPDSDLYVFDHSNFGACVCFGCLLQDEVDEYGTLDNYSTRSLTEMLAHAQRHREAGHKVPRELETKLKERWAYTKEIEVVHLPDDEPEPSQHSQWRMTKPTFDSDEDFIR